MHKLLARQLKRLTIKKNSSGYNLPDPEQWQQFVKLVEQTYRESDAEKNLIENTLELVSGELAQRTEELIANLEELKNKQKKIRHQALHDSLTSLPNRSLFLDRLEHAIESTARTDLNLAVVFIDLDHFKKINDSCGHHEGDQVLKESCRRIQSCIRSHDTLARFGGDEFVLLIEGIKDIEVVHNICSRILKAVMSPYTVQGVEFHLSASLGVSIFPQMAQQAQKLLKQADIAMYEAKKCGRNGVKFFTACMETDALDGIAAEQKLRRAIFDHELNLFYQPKVDALSRKVIGFEALIRWFPVDAEPIAPDKIIPLAEKTGLITLIGRWAIREACSQIRCWIDKGLEAKSIAVNLSAKELQATSLIEDLELALSDFNIAPSLLEIEITETTLVENIDAACEVLNSLRDLGVNISLDDFGTGYSSLGYLQKLPIQFLKIDKSFVMNLESNSRNEAIIGAIIALGQNLGFSVIAEGVEDKQTADFLAERKCDALQGYYFYKPMPAAQAAELLQAAIRVK